MVKRDHRSGLGTVFLAFVIVFLIRGQTGNQSVVAIPGTQEVITLPEALVCSHPTPETETLCRQLEQHILDVTVRIEMQGFIFIGPYRSRITRGAKSHATVVGGRYLVTHNHFGYDLTTPALPDGAGYTGITLRKADGELLLENAPLTAFSIIHEDPETLVLEFLDGAGNGLLETLSQPSAELIAWDAVPWEAGLELAHVDWDENTAFVVWVTVDKVYTGAAVPQVQVSNFAWSGASGAGNFWHGYHVGNNWARNVQKDPETGAVIRRYTIVALNSEEVVRVKQ